jgi:hypothetical protein
VIRPFDNFPIGHAQERFPMMVCIPFLPRALPVMTAACVEPLPLYRPRDPQASDLWQLLASVLWRKSIFLSFIIYHSTQPTKRAAHEA